MVNFDLPKVRILRRGISHPCGVLRTDQQRDLRWNADVRAWLALIHTCSPTTVMLGTCRLSYGRDATQHSMHASHRMNTSLILQLTGDRCELRDQYVSLETNTLPDQRGSSKDADLTFCIVFKINSVTRSRGSCESRSSETAPECAMQ